MRKWSWLRHNLKIGEQSIKKRTLNWNPQGDKRRGKLKKTWKRTFWRKQVNAAKHGEKLRGWQATVSW
jgi:hypothetical protein